MLPDKTIRKQFKPEYDENHENNTKSTRNEKTIFNKSSTAGSSQTQSVKVLPIDSQNEQPQNRDSEHGNEKETPVQDNNPLSKDNDADLVKNENGDANTHQHKLLNVPHGKYHVVIYFLCLMTLVIIPMIIN